MATSRPDSTCATASPTLVSAPRAFSLSFEDAVRLFKLWGFLVEPGPRPEQVTLILEQPGARTYTVYEARLLPAIAAEGLRVRWLNGSLVLWAEQPETVVPS